METEFEYYPQDHPWVEMGKELQQDGSVEESSLSEELRYTLDEIRVWQIDIPAGAASQNFYLLNVF